MKKSWNVRITRLTGHRNLTVPSYLETAPEEIKYALIEWALLPLTHSKKIRNSVRQNKTELENRIQSYILSLDIPRVRVSRLNPEILETKTRGNIYDLRIIFDSINNHYFGNSLSSALRWGSYHSLTSYQTTKTSKDGSSFHLITIAGVYNHPDVPLYAIEGVMYHEMLHIQIPPFLRNGKHVIHGADFKKHERQFEQYNSWRLWERTHLRALARNLKRRRVKELA